MNSAKRALGNTINLNLQIFISRSGAQKVTMYGDRDAEKGVIVLSLTIRVYNFYTL
jgi:hypothetical protein